MLFYLLFDIKITLKLLLCENKDFAIYMQSCYVCYLILFVWLRFYVPVNSYGYVEIVSAPNQTIFQEQFISTLCTYFRL